MKLDRTLCALTIICLVLGGGAVRAATSGEQLAQDAGRSLIGTRAPRLVLKTIDGETIDLGHLYGKQAVYLKFWATWCVPCRQQMPHFEHIYETAGPDLAVIAINTGFNDSIDEVRAYRRQLGIAMPIVLDDGRLGGAFNLRVTPQHIVIGRDGRIHYVGHLADAHLDAALVAARAPSGAGAPDAGAAVAGAPAGTSPQASAAVRHYGVGDRLPQQSPRTVDGRRFQFRDPADPRRIVLVFLSPWCESYLATTRPAVSANCRRMREQVSELAGESSARWLGIASGLWATPEDLRDYRSNYSVGIPLSLDESGALFRAFNVNEVPAALIADGNGRILRTIAGDDVERPAALRTAIEAP
jgi:peroxiredoxin